MTDAECTAHARNIYEDLRQYGPRDASSILLFANWLIIQATFPPGDAKQALAAIDAEAELLRSFVREGWQ